VYLITSLAVTQRGARRMTQYEIARIPYPSFPGGLTLNGPGAVSDQMPNSQPFRVSGDDMAPNPPTNQCPNGRGAPVHAISVIDQQGIDNVTTEIPDGRLDHYTSGCDAQFNNCTRPTPDVVSLPNDPTLSQDLGTVQKNEEMVAQFKSTANTRWNGSSFVSNDPTCATSTLKFGVNPINADNTIPLACQTPRITYAEGDATISGTTNGYGILVVTGTLTITGNFAWDGIVIAIGEGTIDFSGGGNGTINGGIYVARTRDDSGNLLSALGQPSFHWGGGGGNGLRYNSCYVSNGAQSQAFRIITYREMTY
jgi:hypothetical protein